MTTENQQLTSQFLQHMSKVYRYVLQNKEKNFVNLQTELDFIKNYVFLAETRFGGALKITFEMSEQAHEQAIVPVTLQILIENALKHNIVDHERPLSIDVFTSGDYLVISSTLLTYYMSPERAGFRKTQGEALRNQAARVQSPERV